MLRGSNDAAARATWAAIAARGGIPLPEIDAHHFGDVDFQITPGREARFYYELRDGRVTRTEASGPQPDHQIEARAVYEAFCDPTNRVSFVESRRVRLQELKAYLAAHPEIVVQF